MNSPRLFLLVGLMLNLLGCAAPSLEKVTIIGRVNLYVAVSVLPGGNDYGYVTIDVEQPSGFGVLDQKQIWVRRAVDLKVPGGVISDGDTIAFEMMASSAAQAPLYLGELKKRRIVSKRRN